MYCQSVLLPIGTCVRTQEGFEIRTITGTVHAHAFTAVLAHRHPLTLGRGWASFPAALILLSRYPFGPSQSRAWTQSPSPILPCRPGFTSSLGQDSQPYDIRAHPLPAACAQPGLPDCIPSTQHPKLRLLERFQSSSMPLAIANPWILWLAPYWLYQCVISQSSM